MVAGYAAWRWVDYVVMVLFGLATVFIGKFFSRRNQSTDAYFLGSRNLPGWAVGFSMLATLMSSITFLAYPATTMVGDWRLYPKDFMVPLAQFLAVMYIAPRFRDKPGRVSAYEVLEERFNVGLRLYGAATYILAQVLKLGTVLYLVSIPVGIIAGSSSQLVIVASGAFVAAYSFAGGISAVVYTDVVQGIVLLLGGMSAAAVATAAVQGRTFALAADEHKLAMGEWRFDWQHRTIPTVLVYGLTSFLGHTMSYQHTVQRYLLVPNDTELRRAIGLSTLLSIPTWGLFYLVGTCVWAYYYEHPDPEVKALLEQNKADQVFPHFMMNVLPPGLAGLVVSGVFAAAMSTMDSSLNAVASVVVTDIVRRLVAPGLKDVQYLRIGRAVSVVTAALMVSTALVLAGLQKESMNDLYNGMQSILGGPVIGLFTVALFCPRVQSRTAAAAVVVSSLVNLYLVGAHYRWFPTDAWSAALHAYWVSMWVNAAFFATVLMVETALAMWQVFRGRAVFRYLPAEGSCPAELQDCGDPREGGEAAAQEIEMAAAGPAVSGDISYGDAEDVPLWNG